MYQRPVQYYGVSWSDGGEIIPLSFCFLHTFVSGQTSTGPKPMILTWQYTFLGVHMSGIRFLIFLTTNDRHIMLRVKAMTRKVVFLVFCLAC